MAKTAHTPHGSGHFLQERLSSAALGVLAPLFAILLVMGNDGTAATFKLWLATPLNAWVTAAFLLVSLWHMMMGMDVIIDDYIAKPAMNGLLKLLNYGVCFAAAGAGLYAIYTLINGGASL